MWTLHFDIMIPSNSCSCLQCSWSTAIAGPSRTAAFRLISDSSASPHVFHHHKSSRLLLFTSRSSRSCANSISLFFISNVPKVVPEYLRKREFWFRRSNSPFLVAISSCCTYLISPVSFVCKSKSLPPVFPLHFFCNLLANLFFIRFYLHVHPSSI